MLIVIYIFSSDLRASRSRLLDLIKNPNNTITSIEPAFTSYLSLLYGFMWEVEPKGEETVNVGRPNPSKLRNAFVFKWTHTLLGAGTMYLYLFYVVFVKLI